MRVASSCSRRRSSSSALALILALAVAPAAAQAPAPLVVRARVLDGASGGPLAAVAVSAGRAAVATDGEGRFELTVAADTAILLLTRTGYEALALRAGELPPLIRLQPSVVLLNALTVAVAAPRDMGALSVQRVPGARVTGRGTGTVAEALEGMEGLAVSRPGAWGASMSLRGLGGERLAVLIDGNRVERACTFGMDQQLATVPPGEVRRVEIVSGPGSALLGSGNIGGVVNVVTEEPAGGPGIGGALRFGTATALPGWSAGGSLRARSGRMSGLLALDARSQGDYRAGGGVVAGSGFHDANGRGQIAFEPRPGERISVRGEAYEGRDIGWPAMAGASIPRERRRSGSVDYGRQLGGVLDAVAARAYLQRLDHHMVLAMPMAGGTSTTDAQSRSAVAGARAQLRLLPAPPLQLEAGLEATSWAAEATRWVERTDATGTTGPRTIYRTWPAVRILDAGAFAQGEWRLVPVLAATGGLRADRVVRRAADVPTSREWVRSGNLGLRATLPRGFAARAALGFGYRIPDPTELFGLAPRPDGFIYRGNPALSTETGRNLELSLRYESDRFTASVTPFRNDLRGLITPVLQPGDSVNGRPVRSYVNLAHARITGATAAARWQALSWVDLSGSVSRTRGDILPDGTPLPAISPLEGLGAVRVQRPRRAGWAEVELAGALRQDRISRTSGEPATPAWSALAVRAGTRWAGTDVVLGVENLLDRAYRAHLDPARVLRPGRNLFVRVERTL